VIPFSCASATASALAKAYADAGVPDRFRFVTVDKGHGVGPDEAREAFAWLARWL
jgi:predicted esterase